MNYSFESYVTNVSYQLRKLKTNGDVSDSYSFADLNVDEQPDRMNREMTQGCSGN